MLLAAESGSSGTDPWLVVGVALIAATAALIGAVIAAVTAGKRQERELAHARELASRELAHDRDLAALDDRRKVLDEAAEFLLGMAADVKLTRDITSPLPAVEVDQIEVRHIEARLIIRLGEKHPVAEAFRDVVRAAIDLERTIERVRSLGEKNPLEQRMMITGAEEKVLDVLRAFLLEAKSAAS